MPRPNQRWLWPHPPNLHAPRQPRKDEFYGLLVGVVVDPFGHKWHISTPIETVSFEEMQKRCDTMFAGNA